MPTDTERREVARRLRELKNPYWHGSGSSEAYMDVMGVETYLRRNGLHYDLADLIEPPTRCPHYHSGRHYCSIHEDMALIDRDALLELADEMQGYADGAASGDGFPYVNAGSLWSYADRIREALGVDDG